MSYSANRIGMIFHTVVLSSSIALSLPITPLLKAIIALYQYLCSTAFSSGNLSDLQQFAAKYYWYSCYDGDNENVSSNIGNSSEPELGRTEPMNNVG